MLHGLWFFFIAHGLHGFAQSPAEADVLIPNAKLKPAIIIIFFIMLTLLLFSSTQWASQPPTAHVVVLCSDALQTVRLPKFAGGFMKRVLVPFTTGVEEIELVAVVDILRRAELEVKMVSLDGHAVTGRSHIIIQADGAIEDVVDQHWDMLVLPGGQPNAHLLRDNHWVKHITLKLAERRTTIAAICAAPTALAAFGLTRNKRVTSYPACEEEMKNLQPSSKYVQATVVEDDFLITSRGAGTAVAFALHLVAAMCGQTKADAVRLSIVA